MALQELMHDNDRAMHKDETEPKEDDLSGEQTSAQITSPLVHRIPLSDSGICLTPQSQASALSPQLVQEESEPGEVNVSSQTPEVAIAGETGPNDHGSNEGSLHHDVSRNKMHSDVPADHVQAGSVSVSHSRSSTPGQSKLSHLRFGRSGSSLPNDDFTYQTKYVVLQFLHQATTEQHLMHLSQNSLSTTSESEPRFKSYAQRFRRQWQKTRSHSSPTSPQAGVRPKALTKMKGSKSSPNLKDAHFFKDVPPKKRKSGTKPSPPSKPNRSNKRSPPAPRKSPVQAVSDVALIRSVSENTENSEGGTYISDADDELDASFDSSMQGSTTSQSFRNRLSHFHQQQHSNQLPILYSEAESLADGPLSAAEESITEENGPFPIMNLDLDSVQQQAVSTNTQYERVSDYLSQMRDATTVALQDGDMSISAATDTTLQNIGEDEVDSPPFHLRSHPDQAALEPEHLQSPEPGEDGAMSGGFELYEGNVDETEEACVEDEVEGACGGTDLCDGTEQPGAVGGQSRRGDRSRLTLELPDQDAALLIDAVHSLKQEIEEEMSSFESEFEEAIQSLQSDQSGLSHSLSQSRSISPETAEIARKLARIGDDVQQRYFDNLDKAVGRLLLDNCAGLFTYESFRNAAMLALDRDLRGWVQVVTLLLYSQQVALHMTQAGRRGLHRIIDYTVQLLADTSADFIFRNGGWAGLSAVDQSSTPSTPDHSVPISNPLSAAVSTTADTASSNSIPATPLGILHSRSRSAPSQIQLPASGQAEGPLHPVDAPDPGNVKETTDTEGNAKEGDTPLSSQGVSSQSPKDESQELGERMTEEQGEDVDGVAPEEGGAISAGVSAFPLTGYAVSAAVVALAAAAAFSIIRS